MINPFSNFLFLSQKRIRAISRNNPILDFTKEIHPKLSENLCFLRSNIFMYDVVCLNTWMQERQ